jgi:hypothetical protein
MSYEQKYLKYKSKYLALKRELEGAGIFSSIGRSLSRTGNYISEKASNTLKSVKGSLGIIITKGSDIKYIGDDGTKSTGIVVSVNPNGTFNILVRAKSNDIKPTIPINDVPRDRLLNNNTIAELGITSKRGSPNSAVQKALLSSETV